jgi:EAL domain-containing protein (putative c-di-GMP-specific phosphodiesterase class I)
MVLLRRIVDQALLLVPDAEGAVIELVHGAHLEYVCTAGTLEAFVGTRLALDGSLSGLAVLSGETQYCEDSSTDVRVDAEASRRVGAVSMVCVPLHRGGEPVGVLKVAASRAGAFDPPAIRSLTLLGEFMSVVIRTAFDVSRITADLLARESDPDWGAGRHLAGRGGVLEANNLSEFLANVLRPGMSAGAEMKHRIERVIAESAFTVLCQPIVDLDSCDVVGAEALARFAGSAQDAPDAWFDRAHRVGLGTELELAVLKMALALSDQLPGGTYLAVNIGPDAIQAPSLPALLDSARGPIVLELTEHVKVTGYPRLRTAVSDLRAHGARFAVDDTGAGFASLAHIVNLEPDIIKVDRDITRKIDGDPVRRALTSALVGFAADTCAELVAEGIETPAELQTIRSLGIRRGQGYLLGRPAPIARFGLGRGKLRGSMRGGEGAGRQTLSAQARVSAFSHR